MPNHATTTYPNYPIDAVMDPTTGKLLYRGMSKREAFAQAALQGILARPEAPVYADIAAEKAVACADALIAELNRTAR